MVFWGKGKARRYDAISYSEQQRPESIHNTTLGFQI